MKFVRFIHLDQLRAIYAWEATIYQCIHVALYCSRLIFMICIWQRNVHSSWNLHDSAYSLCVIHCAMRWHFFVLFVEWFIWQFLCVVVFGFFFFSSFGVLIAIPSGFRSQNKDEKGNNWTEIALYAHGFYLFSLRIVIWLECRIRNRWK